MICNDSYKVTICIKYVYFLIQNHFEGEVEVEVEVEVLVPVFVVEPLVTVLSTPEELI